MANPRLKQLVAHARSMPESSATDEERDFLVALVEQSNDAADLAWVFRLPELEEAVYGDGDIYAEVGEALVAQARAWSEPKDRAAALTWLVGLSVLHEDCIVRLRDFPDVTDRSKERVRGVREAKVQLFRELAESGAAPLQVAAMHALAHCDAATLEDADLARRVLESSKDNQLRATCVLARGVIARRRGGVAPAADALIEASRRHYEDKNRLVRCCAASAVALLAATLTGADQSVLADHLRKAARLPSGWGWRARRGAYDTRALVVRLCQFAVPEDRKALLDPLIEVVDALDDDEGAIHALLRVAFAGTAPSASGIASRELDTPQRRALELTADRSRVSDAAMIPLGVWREVDLRHILSEASPSWLPIQLEVAGEVRHWHFTKIWYAIAVGELEPAAGVSAIVAGIDREQAVQAATSVFYRHWLDCAGASERAREKEQRAAVHLFITLAQDDAKRAEAILTLALGQPKQDEGVVALWLLTAGTTFGRELSREELALVGHAMRIAPSLEPLNELLRSLPEEVVAGLLVEALQGQLSYLPWRALKFVALAPTQAVMRVVLAELVEEPARREEAASYFKGCEEPIREALRAAARAERLEAMVHDIV